MNFNNLTRYLLVCILLHVTCVSGFLRRCFTCRSRGELGSCKDPFTYNITSIENEKGITSVPCASGWCGKIIEVGDRFKSDEYGVATERTCLQRGPSDSEERCDFTEWHHKRVYMCFCQGDLCNSGPIISMSNFLTAFCILTYFIIR